MTSVFSPTVLMGGSGDSSCLHATSDGFARVSGAKECPKATLQSLATRQASTSPDVVTSAGSPTAPTDPSQMPSPAPIAPTLPPAEPKSQVAASLANFTLPAKPKKKSRRRKPRTQYDTEPESELSAAEDEDDVDFARIAQWERTQADLSWRWSWLQLQVNELIRMRQETECLMKQACEHSAQEREDTEEQIAMDTDDEYEVDGDDFFAHPMFSFQERKRRRVKRYLEKAAQRQRRQSHEAEKRGKRLKKSASEGNNKQKKKKEKTSTPARKSHLSSSSGSLRTSDFDINNVVIPFSAGTNFKIRVIEYKEIFTPKFTEVEDYEEFEDKLIRGELSDIGCASSDDEDTSDEAYMVRHARPELDERRKFHLPTQKKGEKGDKGEKESDSGAGGCHGRPAADQRVSRSTHCTPAPATPKALRKNLKDLPDTFFVTSQELASPRTAGGGLAQSHDGSMKQLGKRVRVGDPPSVKRVLAGSVDGVVMCNTNLKQIVEKADAAKRRLQEAEEALLRSGAPSAVLAQLGLHLEEGDDSRRKKKTASGYHYMEWEVADPLADCRPVIRLRKVPPS